MKLYIAAPYAARRLALRHAEELVERGFEITSSWLGELTEINAGTIGAAPAVGDFEANQHVEMDLADVERSDGLVLLTESHVRSMCPEIPSEQCTTGGRHVETGLALRAGKEIVVVGTPENVFHRSLRVYVAPDWDDAVTALLTSRDFPRRFIAGVPS